jgi:hypothetical protein
MKSIEIQKNSYLVASKTLANSLLICGVFASLLYVAMNIVCAMQYKGYNSASQTVSELSAIDAPTRQLWVLLAMVYSVASVAFGLGLWQSVVSNWRLRLVGTLIVINAIIGLFWPPMHQREVLAAGGGTRTDSLHIIFSVVAVALMTCAMGFSAAAFRNWFRTFAVAMLGIVILFGLLTALDAPQMEANLPTPWIGVWERISIGAYLLWAAVLALIVLVQRKN